MNELGLLGPIDLDYTIPFWLNKLLCNPPSGVRHAAVEQHVDNVRQTTARLSLCRLHYLRTSGRFCKLLLQLSLGYAPGVWHIFQKERVVMKAYSSLTKKCLWMSQTRRVRYPYLSVSTSSLAPANSRLRERLQAVPTIPLGDSKQAMTPWVFFDPSSTARRVYTR